MRDDSTRSRSTDAAARVFCRCSAPTPPTPERKKGRKYRPLVQNYIYYSIKCRERYLQQVATEQKYNMPSLCEIIINLLYINLLRMRIALSIIDKWNVIIIYNIRIAMYQFFTAINANDKNALRRNVKQEEEKKICRCTDSIWSGRERAYSRDEGTHVRAEGEQRLIRVLAAQGRRVVMSVLILRRLLHHRLAVSGDL